MGTLERRAGLLGRAELDTLGERARAVACGLSSEPLAGAVQALLAHIAALGARGTGGEGPGGGEDATSGADVPGDDGGVGGADPDPGADPGAGAGADAARPAGRSRDFPLYFYGTRTRLAVAHTILGEAASDLGTLAWRDARYETLPGRARRIRATAGQLIRDMDRIERG